MATEQNCKANSSQDPIDEWKMFSRYYLILLDKLNFKNLLNISSN